MLKLSIILSALFISLSFISCQKEISADLLSSKEQLPDDPLTAPDSSIQGNYKFLYMTVSSNAANEASSGDEVDKTVTVSQYTTINNAGTIKFDANTMSSSNLAYDINTIAKGYIYANGTLIDSVDTPLQYSAPVSSSRISYRMVGSDSLYCSSGSMFLSNTTQATNPIGVKLQVGGNKLYMTMRQNQSTTQNVQGVNIVYTSTLVATVALERL